MGDLDGGCTARLIAIEGEQALTTEFVEHRIKILGGDSRLLQLRSANSSAGVASVIAHVDETEEHASRDLLALLIRVVIDGIGLPSDRAGESAESTYAASPIVLDVRRAKRSAITCWRRGRDPAERGVGGEPVDEHGIDLDADAGRWSRHGLGELRHGRGAEHYRSPLDRVCETRVRQWSVGGRPG